MIPKFRVWDIENTEMKYFEDYKEVSDMFSALDGDGGVYEEPMQSTGLRDINGKEIYIGDLVKCNISNDFINDCVYEIVDTGFELFLKNKFIVIYKLSLQRYIDYIEILGNIYENPELLEDDNHDK